MRLCDYLWVLKLQRAQAQFRFLVPSLVDLWKVALRDARAIVVEEMGHHGQERDLRLEIGSQLQREGETIFCRCTAVQRHQYAPDGDTGPAQPRRRSDGEDWHGRGPQYLVSRTTAAPCLHTAPMCRKRDHVGLQFANRTENLDRRVSGARIDFTDDAGAFDLRRHTAKVFRRYSTPCTRTVSSLKPANSGNPSGTSQTDKSVIA